MHFTGLAAISMASVATAAPHLAPRAGNFPIASKVTDNPDNAVAWARFPESGSNRKISGYVKAWSTGKGQPVQFEVNMQGLDGEEHPYHIHVSPVPDDGNCTGTGAHLDPTNRGEDPPCDESKPETCQVGDLAGKYGKMQGTSFHMTYSDPYVSLHKGDDNYFGARSVVIHKADKTRIACANWELENYSDSSGNGDVFQYSSSAGGGNYHSGSQGSGNVVQISDNNGNGDGAFSGNYNGGYNGEFDGQDDAAASAAASAMASAQSSAWNGAWGKLKEKFPSW